MERCRELYREWFENHPGTKNPSDLNTEEKFNFAKAIGWEAHCQMQKARKQSFPWTLWEYWEEKLATIGEDN